MSTTTTSESSDKSPNLVAAIVELLKNNQDATARQTELLALLQANQKPRKKTTAEVLARENRQQFKYPVYQNGYEAQPDGLSDETIKRCATVASGRYLNDMVEVVRTGKDETTRIFLVYDNSSIDKRMMLKQYFSSFSDLFVKIHNEMKQRGIKPVE